MADQSVGGWGHAGKSGMELEDAAFLLLDQARIVEGETVIDPLLARRMSAMMQKAAG